MSQEALGHAAGGLAPKHLSQIELGKCDPRLTTVSRIARALGVSLGELYDVDEGGDGFVPTNTALGQLDEQQ